MTKLHHLEEALPKASPATATAVVRNAYTRRVPEQQEVACLMLEEGRFVSTYVLKMKAYLDQMERLGYPMPLILGFNMILTSLSKDYDQFVQNYNMHGMGKTILELHAMLKLAENGIPKKTLAVPAIRQGQIQKPKSQARGKGKQRGKGKSKLAYDPKHKIPPPAKKELPAKDIECHHYHKTEHWKRNCPLYLAELKKNKARLRGYRKLNKGALDLYVGNGNTAAVEAIGSFNLILPSRMILVLDNYGWIRLVVAGTVSYAYSHYDSSLTLEWISIFYKYSVRGARKSIMRVVPCETCIPVGLITLIGTIGKVDAVKCVRVLLSCRGLDHIRAPDQELVIQRCISDISKLRFQEHWDMLVVTSGDGVGMAATKTINNNSIRSIRSILEKEKLNVSNFLDWYHNLRIVLRNEQKLHHLEEALPKAPPATATAAVRNAYTRRVAE
ncbi:hypothetical protein Tco_1104504 [Tanacetum coccineum]